MAIFGQNIGPTDPFGDRVVRKTLRFGMSVIMMMMMMTACLIASRVGPVCADRTNSQTGKMVAAEIQDGLKCTSSPLIASAGEDGDDDNDADHDT